MKVHNRFWKGTVTAPVYNGGKATKAGWSIYSAILSSCDANIPAMLGEHPSWWKSAQCKKVEKKQES